MRYEQLIIMEPVSNFRALARQGLSGRWGDAFIKGFIYLLMINLPTVVILVITGFMGAYMDYSVGNISVEEYSIRVSSSPYGIAYLYAILAGGPLMLGIYTICLRYRRAQEAPHDLILSGFSNFTRILALYLLMVIFIALWSLLFIIPGIIAMYRYRLAVYILSDNPQIGPLEAIEISKGLMRGNKGKCFLLDLSFIGWALLSGLIFSLASIPIVMVFISPVGTLETDMIMPMYLLLMVIYSAVCSPVLMYNETAQAAFYERASGILKYHGEGNNTQLPPHMPQQP